MKVTAKPKRTAITVDMPSWMVKYCDEQAKTETISRSAFIRQLIINSKAQQA